MARAKRKTEDQAADAALANDQDDVFAREGAQATADVPAPAPLVEAPSLTGGPAHNGQEQNGQAEGLPHVAKANTRTDALAKMKYHNDYDGRPQKAAITFDDGKPSEAVRQALKAGGFRWEPEVNAWETDVRFPTREADRLRARATFEKVAEMRREELGVGQQR